MTSRTRWLLPAGIEEVLPENAAALEQYRRKLLDLFASWGYQLVMPPFIEFTDSLLIGESEDLDLQTFKLTDQLSGRSMGIRADMTPQVARIDAHMLKTETPTRLCYCGTVLRTRPESAGGSRSPLQIGAELYGHDGPQSDAEIITLMISTLQTSGVKKILLDLGHAGIFDALIENENFDPAFKNDLFSMLQRKSTADINNLLLDTDCSTELKTAIASLVDLHGSNEVLKRARSELKIGGNKVLACIDYIETLSDVLTSRLDSVEIHFDLAELRGYHYQNNVVFAAFNAESGEELARGGRYNNIGEVFGRARPATGFSADLKQLLLTSNKTESTNTKCIFAPSVEDTALVETINALRSNGEKVITALSNDRNEAASLGCTHILKNENNKWVMKEI